MFKRITMNQNSEAWSLWRHQGIGASDIPIILKLSEFKSRSKLLAEKSADKPPEYEETFITFMGHEAEEKIRAYINLVRGVDLEPACFESHCYDYMRVSLDGICDDFIWECKICGWKKFEELKKGNIPDAFFAQIQYQMFVMVKEFAALTACRFNGKDVFYDNPVSIKVKRDNQFIEDIIIPQVEKFWEEVQMRKNPKTDASGSASYLK